MDRRAVVPTRPHKHALACPPPRSPVSAALAQHAWPHPYIARIRVSKPLYSLHGEQTIIYLVIRGVATCDRRQSPCGGAEARPCARTDHPDFKSNCKCHQARRSARMPQPQVRKLNRNVANAVLRVRMCYAFTPTRRREASFINKRCPCHDSDRIAFNKTA